MSSVENQHRQRFAVIKQWSISGIERPRESFYVEEEFKQRLRENDCDTFFKPVQLNDSEDMHYNLEVSYLIDAFDELPHRVDLAFDSAWKALESALSFNYSSGNTTENLNQFVNEDFLESNDICDLLCKNIPIQSCEYLYNRLIEDSCREDAEKEKAEKEEVKTGKNKSKMTDADRLFNRLKLKENLGIGELIRVLKGRYKNGNGQRCEVHNGPRFIKKVLNKESNIALRENEPKGESRRGKSFSCSAAERRRLLISGLLYTFRCDRFHGDSLSPFLSSKASIKTYTHPYFSFIASYYLLLCLWVKKMPEVLNTDFGGVQSSLKENLTRAEAIFGKDWNEGLG